MSYVERKGRRPFFGCGECSNQWATKAALWRAITSIIEQYPYRRGCYRARGRGWAPGAVRSEVRDLETLVESEVDAPGRALTLVARRIELVIDDDDGLSSFYAKGAGTYVAIARPADAVRIYCELANPRHGFQSRRVTYAILGREVVFAVASPAAFDRNQRIRMVRVQLPPRARLAEVKRCLAAMFAAASRAPAGRAELTPIRRHGRKT